MKTKKFYVFITFMLGVTYCFAQNANDKLLVKYSDQAITDMKVQDPEGYNFLEYFVSEACYVIDMPEKRIDFTELQRIDPLTGELSANQEITEEDLDNFNPLEYNIEYLTDQSRYYAAGNTGKIVVVPSYYTIKNAAENKERVSKLK
ncbi:MAG: hypothetical protein PHE56_07815 [Bacteroidales bacterium]|nr:hypothetical protein [Bacteroidales bacterium]